MAKVTLTTTESGTLELHGEILIHFYSSGDVDTINYPVKTEKEHNNLVGALYDAYNMGKLNEGDEVYLPNGELVGHCEGVDFTPVTH